MKTVGVLQMLVLVALVELKDTCKCPKMNKPVCGQDHVTYDNDCLLDCADVELAHEGECEDRVKRSFYEYEECHCPKIMLPVCGEDDKTYPSHCVRQCVGVDLKHYGKCEDDDRAKYRPKRDDEDDDVIDATDVTPTDAPDAVTDAGSADTSAPEEPPCTCPKSYVPMCGTDGVTYDNLCELQCQDVEVAYFGQC